MTEETSFVHEKLQLSTHIRLVELLPSANIDDDIRCRVRIVNLDDVPRYEAVSYVWGSESDKAEILCGGLALQVPRNLTAAFRRFRQSTIPRLLWADSICINQANISEKNHQVRIMGRIYAGATTVLIWLGEAGEDYSEQVVKGLGTVIELQKSGRIDELDHDPVTTTPSNEDGDSIYDPTNILFDTTAGPTTEVKALVEVFGREWFRRAWTFQESFLAKDRRVFLGSLEIEAKTLRVALLVLIKLYDHYDVTVAEPSSSIENSSDDLIQSAMMLFPGNAHENATLRNLMTNRRGCGCKYAVDLVYSLLEVARDTKSIIPNYKNDFPQVFAEATLAMIQADENFSALENVDVAPRSTNSELPSWVPDWRIPQDYSGIYLPSHLFSCARTTKPSFSMSSNSRKLTTSGFVIDSIKELVLPQEAWNRLEAQEDMGLAWVRNLSCDIDMDTINAPRTKRWDQSTYDMYNTAMTQILQSEQSTEFSAFIDRMIYGAANTSVMTTRCGRKGVAPTNAEAGDFVTVLFGGHVPVLLRPTATKNEFLFVGECYVDQMMDGEAMEQLADVQNRAANNNIALPLKHSSDIATEVPFSEDSNLQLYQIRDFVLV